MVFLTNGSGIIVTDNKMDYTSINEKSTPISADQLSYVKNAIYDYFGVNENIVQNKFDENQWNAFYEGAIEPVSIQMSQCFTNILSTENERNYGEKVIQSLNWINAEKADEYQTKDKDTTPPPKEDEVDPPDETNEENDDEGGVKNGDEQ